MTSSIETLRPVRPFSYARFFSYICNNIVSSVRLECTREDRERLHLAHHAQQDLTVPNIPPQNHRGYRSGSFSRQLKLKVWSWTEANAARLLAALNHVLCPCLFFLAAFCLLLSWPDTVVHSLQTVCPQLLFRWVPGTSRGCVRHGVYYIPNKGREW